MHRRNFIRNLGLLGLASMAPFAMPSHAAATSIRRMKWAPSGKHPNDTTQLIAAEWRYLAGTCTTGQSYGFVVSLGMTLSIENPTEKVYQLLVEKKKLTDDGSFAHAVYNGVCSFDETIDRYIFTGEDENVSAIWDWDDLSGVYRLNLATPELSFFNMVLRPHGDLIAEGGTGTIDVGEISAGGFSSTVGSNYYADWVQLELPSSPENMNIGTARLDMQSLYPTGEPAESSGDYDHNWFALEADLDGEPVYISAWRIESTRGPRWDVTIARAIGGIWSVQSYTEKNDAAQPLEVTPLTLQPIPNSTLVDDLPTQTGSSWHLGAGASDAFDLLDVTLAVPPGQFISTARLGQSSQGLLMEAIGTEASGTVLGRPLTNVRLVVAESTAEAAPNAIVDPSTVLLPMARS